MLAAPKVAVPDVPAAFIQSVPVILPRTEGAALVGRLVLCPLVGSGWAVYALRSLHVLALALPNAINIAAVIDLGSISYRLCGVAVTLYTI